MANEPSRQLYSIGYDERQEAWFVTIAGDATLPLDRPTLTRLVECYNEIHRGAALSLLDRRALVELGQERCNLEATVQSLYDYIDAVPAPPRPGWWARLGNPIRRWMERARA
jgi:hypothetical protein